MLKGKADLIDSSGAVVAVFNETSHKLGATNITVRLRSPLAPFQLQGTESLALYAESVGEAVISIAASDPAGTEISEFHGKSAVGSLPEGTGVALVKNPGGDLSTLLIVLAKGTIKH
jgi:hypothetical protein